MRPGQLAAYAVYARIGSLLALSAAVRTINLSALPPFIDESGHIFGALHYYHRPVLERIREGKVLGYLIFYPTARFAQDPLYMTRLLVAALGVLTVLGVFVLTRRLANEPAAILAGCCWAFMPYVVFHDRMALHDPIVSFLVIWSMVVSVEALKRLSARRGAAGGALLGLAILTKVNAAVAVVWVVLIAAALVDRGKLRQYVKVAAAFGTGLLLPVSAVIAVFAQAGIYRGGAFLQTPPGTGAVEGCWRNVQSVASWLATYNSTYFAVLTGAVLLASIVMPRRVRCALASAFLVSLVAHAVLFTRWSPRYFLPSLLPLAMVTGVVTAGWIGSAAAAAGRRSRRPGDWKAVGGGMVVVLLLAGSAYCWARADVLMSRAPLSLQLPEVDRGQYLDEWPAGYGLEQVARVLDQRARSSGQRVLVFGGGFGAHGWWALPLLAKPGDVSVRDSFTATVPELTRAAAEAGKQPTFLLLEPPVYELAPGALAPLSPPPTLVLEYKRPRGVGGFQLYAIHAASYVAGSAAQADLLARGVPVVGEMSNPNGLETIDGEPFMWLGGGDTLIYIASPRDGVADLAASFIAGPSVTGSPERRLVLKAAAGVTTTTILANGPQVLQVPLRAGTNEIALRCLDKASVAKLPNGDTRPLILGVRGLRVAAFRER
jgi:Dolichyl-phosphate-mannose-protein mannosyltransferase